MTDETPVDVVPVVVVDGRATNPPALPESVSAPTDPPNLDEPPVVPDPPTS